MRNTFRLVLVLCIVVLAIAGITIKLRRTSHTNTSKPNQLIVHEWGTFTSIAGKNGVALEWRPLNGSSDLPKFVHTIQDGRGLRHGPAKLDLEAQVRMETPVIYFYADREMNIQTEVGFPKGTITEWYPQARAVHAGINWGSLKIVPGAALNLPADYSANHYYAARKTDAAQVQVCGTGGRPIEQEKFLFYRGVGSFDLPLRVQLDNGRLRLANHGKEAVRVVVFENRQGQVGYRVIDNLAGETADEPPVLNGKIETVIEELRRALLTAGLYQKEADAMIETWRNSWFEEGMRVFYVLPREVTDATLPLKIDPQPEELVRVLVGRTELITPSMEDAVRKQVKLLSDPNPKVREQAQRELKTYGRFYEPILKRILEDETDDNVRAQVERVLKSSSSE